MFLMAITNKTYSGPHTTGVAMVSFDQAEGEERGERKSLFEEFHLRLLGVEELSLLHPWVGCLNILTWSLLHIFHLFSLFESFLDTSSLRRMKFFSSSLLL